MHIIIAAQNYGFCPTSYALTLARVLTNARSDVKISMIETTSILTFKQLPERADLLISCYEPSAILDAWLNNIPCIYYCNLLWFWLENGEVDMRQLQSDIQLFKKFKKQNKHNEIRELFHEKLSSHPVSGMMYGYFLADRSFCRKYPGCESAIDNLPISIASKIKPIGIFMPYLQNSLEVRSNIVLFQLSGSVTPHTNHEQNEIYIRGCYQLALSLSQQNIDLHFIFCVNSAISTRLHSDLKHTSNLEVRGSVSQKEQFSLLSKVKALFVPPGLGTTYEALYSGTPFFYLPEQNIGQHPNWKLLKSMGIEISACLVNEEIPDESYSVNESSVDNLFHRIDLLFKTRMQHIVYLANHFLQEQVPHWPELHRSHLEKFKIAIGGEPFLIGDDIANIFLAVLSDLKLKLPQTNSLLTFSTIRNVLPRDKPYSSQQICRL